MHAVLYYRAVLFWFVYDKRPGEVVCRPRLVSGAWAWIDAFIRIRLDRSLPYERDDGMKGSNDSSYAVEN